MAALKHEIDATLVGKLARELTIAWPEFPDRQFTNRIAAGLEPLELMARVGLITERLTRALPPAFPAASGVLWKALASPSFTGWMTVPCGMFVARAGIDHPHLALPLLAGLTPRWSSEWSLRPFIVAHREVTFGHLERWVADPDEHVRRLVSEGTRPRLPWAPRLRAEDPPASVALLERLVDDPSPLVRRSVGNHLNDISRDHPGLAVELARRWLIRGEEAAWTVRHGLRTLVKRGDPEALQVIGVRTDAEVEVLRFSVTPHSVSIGESVTLALTVGLPDTAEAADVLIDYRIHHQGARGPNAPRVFKLTRRQLEPGRPQTITKTHRFEHLSIRRIHPGPHIIDVQLNGVVARSATVEVRPPSTG